MKKKIISILIVLFLVLSGLGASAIYIEKSSLIDEQNDEQQII